MQPSFVATPVIDQGFPPLHRSWAVERDKIIFFRECFGFVARTSLVGKDCLTYLNKGTMVCKGKLVFDFYRLLGQAQL